MTIATHPDVGNTTELLTALNAYLATHGLMLEKSQSNDIIGVSILRSWEQGAECEIEGLGGIVAHAWQWEKKRQFIVGDIINIAGRKFGEDFSQYLPADKTLINWASVCAQYDYNQRLFDVSFSHYAEVAYLPDKRARANLLDQAARKNWSVQDLRAVAQHEKSGNATGITFTIWTRYKETSAYDLAKLGEIDWQEYERLIEAYGYDYKFTVETRLIGTKDSE